MKKSIIPILLLFLLLICLLGCSSNSIKVKYSAVESAEVVRKPVLKVYIENSGSMDGYMCDGAELKDAVYGYVSALNSYSDTTRLNYINSQIISYSGSLKSFVRDLTPQQFHSSGGNTGNSDISDMLEKILANSGDDVVSIFVSDCILDVPDGNANNFFVNRQIDIRNAFVKHLQEDKNLGVEIFRLESMFKGWYYYSQGKEFLDGVKRPYYMWVIGNKDMLARLNKDVPFSEIKHGVKNYFSYSTYTDIPFQISNKFGVSKKNISDCKPDRDGLCRIKVKANMSPTLQDNSILTNIQNYGTLNSMVNVESIENITDGNSGYTHLLTLAVDADVNPTGEYVTLKSVQLPDWMNEANDESGKNVTANMDKTTGIKYIVGGVAEAYKSNPTLAGFKFVISKK